MSNFEEFCMGLDELMPLAYDSFPDIELYMDQVCSYLARKPLSFRQDDTITSSMVNNYVKAGIIPRANGKKYSSEHLMYLMIVSRLKHVLSVRDTGILLSTALEGVDNEEYYEHFRSLINESISAKKELLNDSEESLAEAAVRLAVDSYISKVVCEHIVDMIAAEQPSIEKDKKPEKEKKAK